MILEESVKFSSRTLLDAALLRMCFYVCTIRAESHSLFTSFRYAILALQRVIEELPVTDFAPISHNADHKWRDNHRGLLIGYEKEKSCHVRSRLILGI